MRKTYLITAILAALFIAVVSVSLVSAAGAAWSANVNITQPSNGTYFVNYTTNVPSNSNISLPINITFMNQSNKEGFITVNNPALFNATVYYNASGIWTLLGTITTCYFNLSDATPAAMSSCAGNISTLAIPEGVYSLNATLWNGTVGQNVANWSAAVLASNITFNEVPRVTSPNLLLVAQGNSNYTHGANVSGTIIINVTVTEYFTNSSSVFFNITNTSGGYGNWTYKLAQEGTTYHWSNATANIDTAWFPDGMYNITFFAEDKFMEMNDSVMIRNIMIDNTAVTAVVIAKLDSSKTALNATITITDPAGGSGTLSSPACTVNRNLGGAQITIDSTPGVATQIFNDKGLDCGHVYKYTAICTDAAANAAKTSVETSISTDACSASSPAGTSTTSTTIPWTNTIVQSDAELAEKGVIQQSLGSKSRVKLTINSGTHYVGVTEVTATTAKIQVSSTPQDATMIIGDTRMFDVDSNDVYDIKVTLNAINNGKADISIVAISEAVTAESEAAQKTAETAATAATGETGEKETTAGAISKTWIWIIVIVIIIIAVAVGFGMKKKK